MVKTKAIPAPKLDEWEVKHAVDTLQRSEEIKNDPKMMKAVAKEVLKQKKALDKVATQTNKKTPAKKPVKKVTKKRGK